MGMLIVAYLDTIYRQSGYNLALNLAQSVALLILLVHALVQGRRFKKLQRSLWPDLR